MSSAGRKPQLPQTYQHQSRQSSNYCRQKHKHFLSKKLAVIATAIILVLGYANLFPAAAWASAPFEQRVGVGDGVGCNSLLEGKQPDVSLGATASPVTDGLLEPGEASFSQSESTAAPLPDSAPAPVTAEPSTADLTSTTPLSAEATEHVVIISIDGMRPDGLEQADTPTLDELKALGAYSPHAQTINPSFTLPSHVSMLNGVVPQKHGIVEALPCIGCRLTIGPTVFSAAHDAGFSTGMVFGKEKLSYLVLENSVDALFGIDAHDPEVTSEAIKIIEGGLPNLLFIHLPDTDGVGHEYGWMSENYLYAINYADGMVDEIVTTLGNEGYLVSTLLIILADHGGHDFQHGLDCPEDMTIPWLAVGPGVPEGKTLTSPINIYDTAATALYALSVAIPEHWDGRPVLEIFE
jgi:hypothetical protein